jgi:hypothetical protein
MYRFWAEENLPHQRRINPPKRMKINLLVGQYIVPAYLLVVQIHTSAKLYRGKD